MKKILLTNMLAITMLIVCTLSSCSPPEKFDGESGNASIVHDNSSVDLEQQLIDKRNGLINDALSKASTKSLSKVITKQYPEKDLMDQGLLSHCFNPCFSFVLCLSDIHETYPIECMRKMSRDRVYCVYQTEEGGLAYLFFIKGFPYDNDWVFHHSVYVKKALTKKDFSGLKAGDTINDIQKIDPATGASGIDASLIMDADPDSDMMTLHLLRDGLITIQYKEQAGRYVITSIDQHNDYKLTGNFFDESKLMVYDFSILSKDYPK